MKFYLEKGNLGQGATKEQADKVIEMLKQKGWDVEYGHGMNKAEDVSEFGRETEIQNTFADDFMACIEKLGY
jgi:hypothetical protein